MNVIIKKLVTKANNNFVNYFLIKLFKPFNDDQQNYVFKASLMNQVIWT